MFLHLLLVFSLFLPVPALAQAPPAVIPASDDVILERLPRGYSEVSPKNLAQKANPLADAEKLMSLAASSGDVRLASRAERLLATFPASTSNPAVLRLRAYAAQHRHDFDEAARLLGRIIDADGRDSAALFSRAQIFLVQGHLDRARSDCGRLALGVDSHSGSLCVAALSLRLGNADTAATLLDRWLHMPGNQEALLRYALLMRGEAASRMDATDAEAFFRRALALQPTDVRALSAYARYLRARGRHEQILQLLESAPRTDSISLELTLAAKASNHPDAAKMIAAQEERYRGARAAGAEPELREEAEFLLLVGNQPQQALRLALRNFESQRDHEDVDILRRAARAARQPGALEPLQVWASTQGLALAPLEEPRA